MKKLFALLCFFTLAIYAGATRHFANETIRYRVLYKWGMINKQAGHADITLKNNSETCSAQLVAASEPWADKFFRVRDTLNTTMHKGTFKPMFYEKIAHEGSEYKYDTVKFEYNGENVNGYCTRKVVKKGELRVNNRQTLNAVGTTVDMLSSYYYLRSLPFEKWKKGESKSVVIFSGKRKETLTFKYHGIEVVNIGDKRYQCFHITFEFTSKGGKKTSDDMDAWLTTGASRIPVQLEGKLPVGKVRCEIIN